MAERLLTQSLFDPVRSLFVAEIDDRIHLETEETRIREVELFGGVCPAPDGDVLVGRYLSRKRQELLAVKYHSLVTRQLLREEQWLELTVRRLQCVQEEERAQRQAIELMYEKPLVGFSVQHSHFWILAVEGTHGTTIAVEEAEREHRLTVCEAESRKRQHILSGLESGVLAAMETENLRHKANLAAQKEVVQEEISERWDRVYEEEFAWKGIVRDEVAAYGHVFTLEVWHLTIHEADVRSLILAEEETALRVMPSLDDAQRVTASLDRSNSRRMIRDTSDEEHILLKEMRREFRQRHEERDAFVSKATLMYKATPMFEQERRIWAAVDAHVAEEQKPKPGSIAWHHMRLAELQSQYDVGRPVLFDGYTEPPYTAVPMHREETAGTDVEAEAIPMLSNAREYLPWRDDATGSIVLFGHVVQPAQLRQGRPYRPGEVPTRATPVTSSLLPEEDEESSQTTAAVPSPAMNDVDHGDIDDEALQKLRKRVTALWSVA